MEKKGESHRLRCGRVSESGRIYLITTTCHNRTPWFRSLQHGRCFVDAIRGVAGQVSTLCYVVMPDHVHWMMQLESAADLSAVVQKVKSITTHNLRRKCGVSGVVWQRGFHDRALRREEDVKDVARYVIANPLRGGVARSLREYPLWDAVWL